MGTRSSAIPAILAVGLALAACRRVPVEESAPASDGGEARARAAAEAKEERIREVEQNYRLLRERLDRSPDPPSKKQHAMRLFIQNAKFIESTLGVKIPAIERAEKEFGELKKTEAEESLQAFKKLEQEVMAILDGPNPNTEKAGRLYADFGVDRYRNSPIQKLLEDLDARIRLYGRAELEAAKRKGDIEKLDDPVKILAILEGFDPEYDGTPFGKEIQSLVKLHYARYVERREASKAALAAAKPEAIDPKSFRLLWPEKFDATKVEEGVLEVGPNPSEYVQEMEAEEKDLRLQPGTCIRLGDDDWIDVELHFEAQVKAGEGIFFGARGHEGAGGYDFYWRGLGDLGIADDEWHKLLVRIEGNLLRITDTTGGKIVETERLRPHAGPFGIRVTGGRSAIKLRGLQAWVKTREAKPEAPADDEPKKKKKDKKKPAKKEDAGGEGGKKK